MESYTGGPQEKGGSIQKQRATPSPVANQGDHMCSSFKVTQLLAHAQSKPAKTSQEGSAL